MPSIRQLARSADLAVHCTLVTLLALAGCASPPSPSPDAGPPPRATPEAEPTSDAPQPPATAPLPEEAAQTPEASLDRGSVEALEADVRALEALLDAGLPDDFDTQRLFEVDLLSPTAVQSRREALQASIARAEGALAGAAPVEPTERASVSDAGAQDAGAFDAGGQDAGRAGVAPSGAETSRDAGVDGSAGAAGEGEAGEGEAGEGEAGEEGAAQGEAAPEETSPEPAPLPDASTAEGRRRLELELQRDRLRLRFLSLPASEREAVSTAERERRRAAGEREAAAAAVTRAAEEERRAEGARREALDRASTATSALERELLALRAQIELERSELAAFAGSMARVEADLVSSEALRTELTLRIERRRGSASAAQIDALYDELVHALIEVRAAMGGALDSLSAPSAVPAGGEALSDLDRFASFADDLDALQEARSELELERQRLSEGEHDMRLSRATRLAAELRSLNALRLSLIERLSPAHREAVMGLGAEGIAQLRRELNQLWLTVRLWRWELTRDAPEVPAWAGHVLALESSRFVLLRLLAELALAILLAQRRKRVMQAVRDWLRSQKSSWLRVLTPWAELIARLAVASGIIALVALALDDVETLAPRPEFAALRVVVLAYALYRLVLQLTQETALERIVANTGVELGPTSRKARSTLRLLLAFGFGLYVTLALAEAALGRGYLHTLVGELSRWFGLALVAGLVLRWRSEISAHQRSRFPDSRLSAWLSDERSAFTRTLAIFPAAVNVGARAAWSASGDVLLRFERSRRAAAFLFRRRLEDSETTDSEREELPAALTEVFDPAFDDESVDVSYYPKLSETQEDLERWAEGGSGTTLALVGERGIGKTRWLRALVAGRSERAVSLSIQDIHSSELFCRTLCEALELPAVGTIDGVVDAIVAADLRAVVSIDHCQNLVVRAIGGTEALVALSEISARTSDRMFWVASFSRYTWLYLQRVRQSAALFQSVIELGPWTEEALKEFIDRRMARTGLRITYAPLAIASMGAATEETIARTESQFIRVLWDYCDGNPRIAMAFWLRSLSPLPSGELRVRYFDGPEPSALDELSEAARFMLAAIALHENLSTQDAARTMSSTTREAAASLALLASRGYVEKDERGKWRVRTAWYRAVIRHLRRQRLLFT